MAYMYSAKLKKKTFFVASPASAVKMIRPLNTGTGAAHTKNFFRYTGTLCHEKVEGTVSRKKLVS
jgi:hypothetical protein